MKRFTHLLFALLLLPLFANAALPPALDDAMDSDDEEEVLSADQAFQVDASVIDGNRLAVDVVIAPRHYLYKEKFSFALEADGVTLAEVEMPEGEEKNDEFFGLIRVFHDGLNVPLSLARENTAATDVVLVVGYQGCAEIGICYPPQKKRFELSLPAGSAEAPAAAAASPAPAATAAPAAKVSEQDSLATALAGENKALTVLTFFGLGLLLAFTPCVFPMIPILSSIIVGQGEGLTTRRAFTLSLTYVLAMALTYTVAGVLAGLFGANIQAMFQNAWVLGGFALVFVALAMSMFGFYELQLPSSLQGKLATISNNQQSGSLAGVAIMGLLSALIVGPCVAPPLMGALIYIGQTGDAVLGGAALFALSMGMGLPLLAVGTSAGKLLPRAGGWMDAVKAVFGVMLLGVALWMLERVLPAGITLILWAVLVIASAIYMGAMEPIREGASGWRKLWKALGMVLLIHGGLMLVGAAAGSSDPLQPLKGMAVGGNVAAQEQKVEFSVIKGLDELQQAVEAAAAQGKPVMVDFYADWCVACKEFEKYTFSDARVIDALAGVVTLKADVTDNDERDVALLKHFGIIGPPALLFFGTDGNELKSYRMVGFEEPEPFSTHVRQAFGR